jgi:stage V sporulation protein AA
MKKELFFALEKTVYAKDKNVPLHSICSVYGASDEPLKNVLIPLKGEAATVTALDVMARIAPLYPDYAITNLGPTECRVFLQHPPGSPLLKALKAVLLCLVMFFGGAVAIMTFHEDVDMGQVHSNIYAFFTGAEQEKVPVVSVPYSIGVAVGFVMLFGLYRRRKSRPTVLDIDIHNYKNKLRDYLAAQGNRPDG